ncbi:MULTISPECIES: hypothetical protein [Nitrosomonas]|uniref:hypothetical protein n=1 Tax=Nitrosomonas TaxID=914 RepID=UPI00115FA93E|nr:MULTISPECIES: hypothetical protein [Nitrosomonas]
MGNRLTGMPDHKLLAGIPGGFIRSTVGKIPKITSSPFRYGCTGGYHTTKRLRYDKTHENMG